MIQNSLKVLIIDDDEADRALYKKYLSSTNIKHTFTFHEVSNATQGLIVFENQNPDCVILDHDLPDIKGIEFIKSLNQKHNCLPIIMLTGQGSEELAAYAIKQGAQDYIPKNCLTHKSLYKSVISTIEKVAFFKEMETKNKELEIARECAEQQRQKAIKADQAKSDFLAIMSHEIRTPMNGIIGMSELLGYTNLNTKQKQYTDSIRSSGELLLTIINDILDFSKIEAGEMELEKRSVNLQEILKNVIRLLSERANENRVELAVDCPFSYTIPCVKTDGIRIKQILTNLIGNAVKFTKDGHVLVRIRAQKAGFRKTKIRFEIQDTGIGIPEDKIDNIFAQFSQVDTSTTREFGGTGLGLAISKHLIELMGGEIGVYSQMGEGSTFWFDITCETSKQNKSMRKDANLKDKRILIVDDYDLNVDLFTSYLEQTDAIAVGVNSAQNACIELEAAKARDAAYDIVLIDYVMPTASGLTLAQKMEESPELYGAPKKILITALGKIKHQNVTKQPYFHTTLLKPLYPNELIDAVCDALQERTHTSTAQETEDQSLPKFKAHILIVDDDRISRRMAQSVMHELGCTCDIASDGKEAMHTLSEHHQDYDIIFMDWQMPIMDGHETMRRLRKTKWGRHLYIIALTANAIQGDKEKCLQAGADDYLSKPIRVSDVVSVLEKQQNVK